MDLKICKNPIFIHILKNNQTFLTNHLFSILFMPIYIILSHIHAFMRTPHISKWRTPHSHQSSVSYITQESPCQVTAKMTRPQLTTGLRPLDTLRRRLSQKRHSHTMGRQHWHFMLEMVSTWVSCAASASSFLGKVLSHSMLRIARTCLDPARAWLKSGRIACICGLIWEQNLARKVS